MCNEKSSEYSRECRSTPADSIRTFGRDDEKEEEEEDLSDMFGKRRSKEKMVMEKKLSSSSSLSSSHPDNNIDDTCSKNNEEDNHGSEKSNDRTLRCFDDNPYASLNMQRTNSPSTFRNDALSIHKHASIKLLTSNTDFDIKPTEMDPFAEFLQKELGSKDLLEFYLACIALQRIPNDDDFLKKSIKSIYRLFVRKYLKHEYGELSGKYVNLLTLRRIAEQMNSTKICSKDVFQPAIEELLFLLSKYYKSFDDAKKFPSRSKSPNVQREIVRRVAVDRETVSNEPLLATHDTEDEMNTILNDHCNRVFKSTAGSHKKSARLPSSRASQKMRRVETQVLDTGSARPYEHLEFARSVSHVWGKNNVVHRRTHETARKQIEDTRQRKFHKNQPLSDRKPDDNNRSLNATKRTFSGAHRFVVAHSRNTVNNMLAEAKTKQSSTNNTLTHDRNIVHSQHISTVGSREHGENRVKETGGHTHSTSKRSSQKITIVYYLPGESIPFMTPHPTSTITLAQFKESVVCKKLTNCKFFFKTKIDLDECSVVFKEVTDMNELLPLFDRKIIAKIEKMD